MSTKHAPRQKAKKARLDIGCLAEELYLEERKSRKVFKPSSTDTNDLAGRERRGKLGGINELDFARIGFFKKPTDV